MTLAQQVELLEAAIYRELERAILRARWERMGRPKLAGGIAGRPWGKGLRDHREKGKGREA